MSDSSELDAGIEEVMERIGKSERKKYRAVVYYMLVKKFDGELSKKYFQVTLDYMSLSGKEFWEVIDSWRSPHIWEKTEKFLWKLKNPIWKE